MATLCAFDSFVVTTGAIGTTFTRVFTDTASGATFSPTFVFLFWSGSPFSGSLLGRADYHHGRGFAISPTIRGTIGGFSDDGVSPSFSQRSSSASHCMAQALAAGGRLDVDAVLANGMRFIIDEVFSQPLSVGILALGGDLASAGIQLHSGPNDGCASDPVDVTGYGFDPALGLSVATGFDAIGNAVFAVLNMGAFRSPTEQGVWAGGSGNGLSPQETARYSRYGDIALARCNPSGAIAFRNDFNALITDGFRFNCLEDAPDLFIIAGLLGGNVSILEFDTRTTLGPITLTPGFEVSGGIIMSANTAESVDNDSDSLPKNFSMCIGAFSGTAVANQSAFYAFDLNGATPTQVTIGRRGGSVYMRGNEAASPSLAGSIEVSGIGPTTVTLTQSVADPTAAHCIAILFGVRNSATPNMRLLGVGQ